MTELKIVIPKNKVNRVTAAFKDLWPQRECDNDAFTDAAWVKECIKRHILFAVKTSEQRTAIAAAKQAIIKDEFTTL